MAYVKPSASAYKAVLNGNRTSAQLSTNPVELIAVLATAGGSAIAVRIYDSIAGSSEPSPSLDSFVVAANTGESTPFCPVQPVLMTKGLYVEIEQGAAFNPEVLVLYR